MRACEVRLSFSFKQGSAAGLYSDAGSVPALTSSDADEILIGTTTNCKQLGDLLKLQASRLRSKYSGSSVKKLNVGEKDGVTSVIQDSLLLHACHPIKQPTLVMQVHKNLAKIRRP